jgi:hypothetical protein
MFRLTVEATRHLAVLNVEAKFAAKRDVVSERRYRLANKFLVHERSIRFCRVE